MKLEGASCQTQGDVRFTDAFKSEAVRLTRGNRAGRWPGGSSTQVSDNVLSVPLEDSRAATGGIPGPHPPGGGAQEQDELTRLKRENETLREGTGFLKRAAALFARASP